ncbi:hypothetical protein F5890DRAFT_1514973 [Lentinula detonsa]|uniref:Hpc2-related domain-containing protein n=1 Tax=Lentinula detonsa TaxID=2804962 RepID=A0AA38UUG9_9AGAR|nr:hypothetical protein F5890DRAFT_1514973 [Lentinula detonsa]
MTNNSASEYYDVSDPFIDDSELAVDDRKFSAQTKQRGFYVSSGEVTLMKDRDGFLNSVFLFTHLSRKVTEETEI